MSARELERIKQHYVEEAEKLGSSGEATMKDHFIREKEIQMIDDLLHCLVTYYRNPKILEIGCGNGYTASKLPYPLTAIDSCEQFISIANKRRLTEKHFQKDDVTNLSFQPESFDITFSERCLINLPSWKLQKRALIEVCHVLKPKGTYIMVEAFKDGLENLNSARQTVSLDPILQPWHDNYFDKEKLWKHLHGRFQDFRQSHPLFQYHNNFLSSYYFGSRVLYPALINHQFASDSSSPPIVYNNAFNEFFKDSPPQGEYSPIQVFVLEKTACESV